MKKFNKLSSVAGPLVASAALGLVLLGGTAVAYGQAEQTGKLTTAGTSVPLSPDAPAEYVVKRGDTLWDISAKYLSQPWYWPEIWYINPEIKNPHLIYPGDTLRLLYTADGRPQVRVERGNTVVLKPQMRSSDIDTSIPAIPYEIVAAFMSKPSVVSKEEAEKLPYIVAQKDQRLIGGSGNVAYARGLAGEPGARVSIVQLGDRLKDPDDGDFLGYTGIYAGVARLERAAQGSGRDALSKLELVETTREVLDGDRLVAEKLDVPLSFVPHAPAQKIDGRLIAVIDGVTSIGQYQVVAINRGKRHGLEPGHVLSILQRGDKVKDYGPKTGAWHEEFTKPFAKSVQLPAEHAGTFMVFRVYDRMSYGLVMAAQDALHVGDLVVNPDRQH